MIPKAWRVAACVFAFTPASLVAQAPGYQQIDVGAIRAEYNAEVLTQINAHLADWGEAWANDKAEALADLYWEDALLVTPDGLQRRGEGEIREYFETRLSEHGTVEAFMLDFDASGGMAQVFGNYMLVLQGGESAGRLVQGPMMTVYLLRGRTWKIRSQIFLPAS
ncbi:MAG: SgcJ/EcaC family oxidoreductase [Gemmatimonadetes bacterium]|nr:SgcJ/EcaC family oxidoreductase [Gemmatimonadota bacterium]NNL29397.1 SgcJ/EcaC family oxidoreductase [Gemmatimonadota bacterium]